ncbi:MAG: protein SidB [Legionellales bacterium]
MANYKAPEPTYKEWQRVKSIAIRILCPPILIWDLLKLVVNKLAGVAVGRMILPAQRRSNRYDRIIDDKPTNPTHEYHTIVTHDGVELDTLEMKHCSKQNNEPQDQKYIINFLGNAQAYQQILSTMQTDADTLQSNVIGFNFRGVGRSTGNATSTNDLLIDGIAQVQRLLDLGVTPQNITLKGYSIGAAVASLVAHHFHQQNQPINVFSDRSFSSLTNVLVGWIRTHSSPQETFGMKLLGWLAKPFIKLALILTKWEINADDAFLAIPEAHREYVLVRSPKNVRTDEVIDDSIITHYASIHAALKDERQAKKAELDAEIINNQTDQPHLNNKLTSLTEARAQFKKRKMQNTAPNPDGHEVSMRNLLNSTAESAQTFFQNFVLNAHQDHAIHADPIRIMLQ